MSSAREMRLRIRSVKNIAQVTRALETVSASKVKKAIAAMNSTRPYAEKAWKVLVHLAQQPGRSSLHPLLQERKAVNNVLVVMVSSDRGLSGAYNVNIVRHTLDAFSHQSAPVTYVAVGRKGRDMLLRRGGRITAEFSGLPANPTFQDVSAIGRLVVEDFLSGKVDRVYIAYTEFKNMMTQEPVVKKLLPLDVEPRKKVDPSAAGAQTSPTPVYIYEPDQAEILDLAVERFTGVQIYQAVLTSLASEHAARMVAMRNATDNANELASQLQLEYNKIRQQSITNEMLDIAGGAEALHQALAARE